MDEPEVVLRVKSYFESQGFRMKGQPDEGDITLNGGDIRCDLQGFKTNKDSNYPQLLWIECKGDYIALKELLSDFVSLLLILDEYGGQAVFVCPDESYKKIMEYKEFLERLQSNIAKGKVEILNASKIDYIDTNYDVKEGEKLIIPKYEIIHGQKIDNLFIV